MDTILLTPDDLTQAADLIKKGQLVAFPTETVYGLGASIFQEQAVKKIFEVKGRPQDNPLIVHVSSLEMLFSLVDKLPSSFNPLVEAFFPGPLTLILHKKEEIISSACAGLKTIAIRMPAHPVARKLIALVNEPIVAPSANLSGLPSSTHHEHVLDDFSGKVSAVITAGDCDIGLESTVISLVQDPPLLLRPGGITKEQIEKVLKAPISAVSPLKNAERPLSPGLKYRHYAPRCPVKVFERKEELLCYIKTTSAAPKFILSNEDHEYLQSYGFIYTFCRKNLFALFRFADKSQVDEILILCDPLCRKDSALMNRISRAAAETTKG